MPKRKDSLDDEALRERILLIMEFSELEIAGFAEFVGVSESHLYAVLNGNKRLSIEVAGRIAKRFGLKTANIFRPGYKIPANIREAPELLEFFIKEKSVPEYFRDTQDKRKPSYFIENVLLSSSHFSENEVKYLWETREFCRSKSKYYTSNRLSKLLKYQVTKGNLLSVKRPIKRKNGTFGTRKVNVFFLPPKKQGKRGPGSKER